MQHPDTTCYIIGKGPSLDTLTAEDFDPGPIITINESIVKIEQLDLPNPTYSLQQDGKPQCMRRPKKATLLLSQKSKHWYKDYSPREIYNQESLGGSDDAFSALVAIALAKKMACNRIIFKCFDSCICGDGSYAKESITYSDPNNSLARFQLHCDTIKLSLAGMPAAFDNIEIKAAPYTIITPTGDRTELLRLCRKYILRQTVLPAQWIIVDDGKIPTPQEVYYGATYIRREPKSTDPSHTLCTNMLEALSHVTQPNILIFEDDDWYHPEYAERILAQLTNHDLVGIGYTYYCHYPTKKYIKLLHPDRASWCTTGFKQSLVQQVQQACRDEKTYLLDLHVWGLDVSKKVIETSDVLHVGLKGLAGRKGLTGGHQAVAYYHTDDGNKWLKESLGDDLDAYKPLSNVETLLETKARGCIRYSHDGSFFIPRNNRMLEALLDSEADRVPKQLRWYPRIEHSTPLDTIIDIFKDKTCYIIGKGRSLDNLSTVDFEDSPIIAINEAIHKVESLNLPNPIFMLQQDTQLGITCWPMVGTVLVPSNIARIYHKHDRLCTFTLDQLGLIGAPATVIVAIELTKLLRSKDLKFLCFDAYTQKETAYAECVGYPAEKFGAPERFLRQAYEIRQHIIDIPHEFITPKDLP